MTPADPTTPPVAPQGETEPTRAEFPDGIEWFTVGDGNEDCQCARCGSSAYSVDCFNCGGNGYVDADFGDGIVPDVRLAECEYCDGKGGWWRCCSGRAWCNANQMPGRDHVKSTARCEDEHDD